MSLTHKWEDNLFFELIGIGLFLLPFSALEFIKKYFLEVKCGSLVVGVWRVSS
jgi:hypothetical protein